MYKKILVPLDGSKRAEQIIPHVKSLATCTGAEIILLQVVLPDSVVIDLHGTPPAINAEIMELRTIEADGYLEDLVKNLHLEGFDARKIIEVGAIVETIITIAEQANVSLIAMASHGRTGLARVFYGSVAAGVLNRIDHPLLLIRAEKEAYPG